MIYFLKKGHIEPLSMQMECKEHGKISLKSISELTDIPMYKSTMIMPNHIRDFESYCPVVMGLRDSPWTTLCDQSSHISPGT